MAQRNKKALCWTAVTPCGCHEAGKPVFFIFFLVTFTVNRYIWSEIKLALHCYMESNVLKYNYLGDKPPKFAIYETLSLLFS